MRRDSCGEGEGGGVCGEMGMWKGGETSNNEERNVWELAKDTLNLGGGIDRG